MRNQKKIAALATGALVLGSAGVAYAYWTTTGSGSGSGSTSDGDPANSALTFTQNPDSNGDATALDEMYPGDSSQPLTVTVTNNDDETYYVTSVKAYITTDKGADCDGSNFLLGGAEAPSTALTAAALTWSSGDLAGGDSRDATSSVQFRNTATNQDACKGAVVTIHYLAS